MPFRMKDCTRIKKISLFVLLASLTLSVRAQNENGLNFLSNVSQASLINPAYQNKTEDLIVGLPVISGINFQWNSNFAVNNILGNNFTINFEKFYESIDDDPDGFGTASIPLVFVGLKQKNQTFSFGIYDKIIADTQFDKEILHFVSQGLLPYYGRDDSFGPISFKASYFREVSIGYATEIWEGFNVGIRSKVLFEKLFYQTENTQFTTSTYESEGNYVVHPHGSYQVSGPLKVNYDEETGAASVKPDLKPADYFFRLRNMGAAIDFGLSYKPNKQSEIQFSVSDLGFTSHKKNTYNVIFTDSLLYQKNELYQSSDTSAANYLSVDQAILQFRNSVPDITTVNPVTKRQLELLPVQINFQIKYQLTTNTWLGGSNNYTWYKNHSNNYLSGFVSTAYGKHFETAGFLTLNNIKKILPGLSWAYTGKHAQFYLSTNNILTMIKPTSSKNLNLCFGVNLLVTSN